MSENREANRRALVLTSGRRPDHDRTYHHIILTLKKFGWDVTYVTPGAESDDSVTKEGVRLITLLRGRGLLGRFLFLLSVLRLALRADCRVVHCVELDVLAVGALLKVLRGRKLVYDCNELTPQYFAQSRPFPPLVKRLVTVLVWWVERFVCFFVDEVLDVNELRAERFMRIMPRRTTILMNVPLLDYVEECLARQRETSRSGDFVIASTGFFNGKRALDHLTAAIAKLNAVPGRRFRFMGIGKLGYGPADGDETIFAIEKWHADIAASLGVADYIEITGWVPYEEMYRRLAEADAGIILLLPDRANNITGLPTKIFDFMALGMPVIASDFPEIRKAVQGSGAGFLVDAENPDEIASAIRRLAEDPVLMNRMGENGRRAVREKYNWDVMAPRLMAAYDRLWKQSL